MLFLDFLLLVMTSICVIYCWILNKRIHELQNSRIEFARMIKELNVSIVKAENNVNEMSALSKVTSAEIKSVVDEAKEAAQELLTISEVAQELSSQLNGVLKKSIDKNDALEAKANDRFSEEDLADLEMAESGGYADQIKNFIQKIMVRKTEDEDPINLNQMSYYDTLRKISAKK